MLSNKTVSKLDDDTRAALTETLENLDGSTAVTAEQLEKALVSEAQAVLAAQGDPPDCRADTVTKVLGVTAAQAKAILTHLSVRDPDADPVTDKKGNPQPDTALRDTENIPLTEDIDTFIAREVVPFAPDAWVDRTKMKVGYEIPFTRHFYKYEPPRPLAEIDADIKASQQRILTLLAEVTK